MALEQLRAGIAAAAQAETAATDRRATYIANLIGSNAEEFRDAFLPKQSGQPVEDEEAVGATLFRRTTGVIELLGAEALSFVRVPHDDTEEDPAPHDALRLGWAELDEVREAGRGESQLFYLKLTDAGRTAIDGLRTALGQPTLKAQHEADAASWQERLLADLDRHTHA